MRYFSEKSVNRTCSCEGLSISVRATCKVLPPFCYTVSWQVLNDQCVVRQCSNKQPWGSVNKAQAWPCRFFAKRAQQNKDKQTCTISAKTNLKTASLTPGKLDFKMIDHYPPMPWLPPFHFRCIPAHASGTSDPVPAWQSPVLIWSAASSAEGRLYINDLWTGIQCWEGWMIMGSGLVRSWNMHFQSP